MHHQVFVTSELMRPTSSHRYLQLIQIYLGGQNAADWICTFAAYNAGLLGDVWNGLDLIYKAILSTPTSYAKDRIQTSGPIYNMHGDLVANDAADLWDGSIAAPISYDEYGSLISGSSKVWSGSNFGGSYFNGSCGEWNKSTSSYIGRIGNILYTTGAWLSSGSLLCDQTARLYCVSPVLGSTTPYVDSLSVSSFMQGADYTLTANGVTDDYSIIVGVEFYRDADADGQLDATDEFLGPGTRINDTTWSYNNRASEWPVGPIRFLARAADLSGYSSVVSAAGNVDPLVISGTAAADTFKVELNDNGAYVYVYANHTYYDYMIKLSVFGGLTIHAGGGNDQVTVNAPVSVYCDGLNGQGIVTVIAGQLTAPSIVADTLLIGSGAGAVVKEEGAGSEEDNPLIGIQPSEKSPDAVPTAFAEKPTLHKPIPPCCSNPPTTGLANNLRQAAAISLPNASFADHTVPGKLPPPVGKSPPGDRVLAEDFVAERSAAYRMEERETFPYGLILPAADAASKAAAATAAKDQDPSPVDDRNWDWLAEVAKSRAKKHAAQPSWTPPAIEEALFKAR